MAKSLMQKLSLFLRSQLPGRSSPPPTKEHLSPEAPLEPKPMAAEPSLSEAIQQKARLASDAAPAEAPEASHERRARLAKPEGPRQ
jgi:hypothetical protein